MKIKTLKKFATKTNSPVDGASIQAMDLFCGAGGLSCGLSGAGLKVVAGVDVDAACEFAFTTNIKARFVCSDVSSLEFTSLKALFDKNCVRVLAGCAPCQPFSRYARGAEKRQSNWSLLMDFANAVQAFEPEVITVENVPELAQHLVFSKFLDRLKMLDYSVKYDFLYCPDYGVPQRRKRLVLMGSRLGVIELPKPTHADRHPTVREAIGDLNTLDAGQNDDSDELHRACKLTKINLERVRTSKPGGTWREWPKRLRAQCHRVESGTTYPAVYGRMEWDEPSPTITTQFFGYGNGRFGHPDQDRAISLREGALLQTFPKDYRFHDPNTKTSIQKIGQLIGNAVPVRLGYVIGESIIQHIKQTRAAHGKKG